MGDEEGDNPVEQDAQSQAPSQADDEPMSSVAKARMKRESLASMNSISLAKRASRKTFVGGGAGVSRQQMIEYVALLRWSRASWLTAPYALVIWIIALILINWRSVSWVAYPVRAAFLEHLLDLEAVPWRGVAPIEVSVGKEVGIMQGGSSCTCTCGLSMGELCGNVSNPTLHGFNGTMSLPHVAEMRAQSSYFQDDTGGSLVDMNATWKGLKWDNILSKDDALRWLQHALLPDLWDEVGRDAPLDYEQLFNEDAETIIASGARPGVVMDWMQIIGGVRLRQRRLNTGDCGSDNAKTLARRYGTQCHENSYQVTPYGPGVGSYAEGFVPEDDNLGAFDVQYNMDTPFRLVLENYEYMLKHYNWIDDASDSLQVQAAMLHAESEPPLFVMFEARFDFRRSGHIEKSLNVFITSTEMFPAWIDIILNIMWAILLCFLLFTTTFEAMSTYLSQKKRDMFILTKGLVSDWVVIIFSIGVAIGFFLIEYSINELIQYVMDMPTIDTTSFQSEIDDYKDAWSDILDRVDEVSFYFATFRVALFWYSIAVASQLVKFFAGQPKMSQLLAAFSSAQEDLLHFLMLFVVLFATFAIAGFMMYGFMLKEWSTLPRAVASTLRALMGKIELDDMFASAPISTVAWYGMFITAMVIIILNLLVALVYDHYTLVQGQAGAVPGIFSQLGWVWKDYRARTRDESCWWKLTACCRKSTDGMISQHEILEGLMDRSHLPPAEQVAIRTDVLGARVARKEREKALFAGTDGGEQPDTAEPAMNDLIELGAEDEYAQFLIKEGKAFAQMAYDPEDAKTAQLRQLVANAEEHMMAMKVRLQSCAEYTKDSMHGLTRCIDSLEELVHETLAELVTIADEAGVPTGGQAGRSTAPRASPKLGSTATAFGGTAGTGFDMGGTATSFMQTGMTAAGSTVRGSADLKTGKQVETWTKASRKMNLRKKRAEAPPNAKFYGPKG